MKRLLGILIGVSTLAFAQLPQDQIFRMNNPAVFMLTATQAGGSTTTATAFCVRQDGILVTTWSTICNASSAMVRSIYDKDIKVLGVLAHDAEHNIAVLKVDDGGLSEVQLGQSTYTTANELVFIIGDSAPSVNRMVLGKISEDYKKAREIEELQPVIPVVGAFTARDNGAPILSGSGGRAIGIALATDPTPGADAARTTAVVIPIEDVRAIMKSMVSAPQPLSPHGEYEKTNEGHYWAGRLDEVNHSLGDAIEHYRAVLAADPKNGNAAFQLGYALEAQGNHADAEQAYGKATVISPKEPKGFHNLGLIQYAAGKYAEAQKSFTTAANLGTKFVKAWDWLGMSCEKLKQPDKALAAYSKAREIKETDLFANLRIAWIYYDQQKWGEAAKSAKKSREAGADPTDIYFIEADSYLHMRNYLQAWDLANRGMQRDAKNPKFWAIMVESSRKGGNAARAKEELDQLQALDPEMAKQFVGEPASPK